MAQGIIVKAISGFYYVDLAEEGLYECKAKGIFRKEGLRPVVGDRVEISILDREKHLGNLEEVLPRTNALIRPLVANVDGALVIFAAREPDPNLNLLDRFLVMMEYQDIPVTICFNKADLATEEELEELQQIYSAYPVLTFSAKHLTEENKARLHEILSDRVTTVAGPSGAGKSTLVNHLQDREVMETGAISEKANRGKHTTRHAQLIPLQNGYIVDTPGFSTMEIPGFTKEDLAECYPEMLDLIGQCRFTGCAHINEPDCAVKQAVTEGRIHPVRYENYKKLYEILAERKAY